MCNMGEVVMPGENLSDLKESEATKKTVVGPGLRRQGESIVVTKPGILKFREPNFYWVDCHHKRYVPVKGENVLGIVTSKAGDVFRIDVGGSEQASLSYLNFEGATKRNRPDVKVGDLVYARFSDANKDIEPELTCVDGAGRSNGLAIIRGNGLMFQCSLNLVRKMLSAECNLLKALGAMPYEIVIGMNGRVYVEGRSTKETIALVNAIDSAEFMDNTQIKQMVRKVTDALAGF